MMQRDGRSLRYVLFKPIGIVGPTQVRQRANRSPLGYVSSAPLRSIELEEAGGHLSKSIASCTGKRVTS